MVGSGCGCGGNGFTGSGIGIGLKLEVMAHALVLGRGSTKYTGHRMRAVKSGCLLESSVVLAVVMSWQCWRPRTRTPEAEPPKYNRQVATPAACRDDPLGRQHLAVTLVTVG